MTHWKIDTRRPPWLNPDDPWEFSHLVSRELGETLPEFPASGDTVKAHGMLFRFEFKGVAWAGPLGPFITRWGGRPVVHKRWTERHQYRMARVARQRDFLTIPLSMLWRNVHNEVAERLHPSVVWLEEKAEKAA